MQEYIGLSKKQRIEHIYKRHGKDLFNMAYSILNDRYEAEDVLQNFIIHISKHTDKLENMTFDDRKAYLLVCIRNFSITACNKAKKVQLVEFEEKYYAKDDENSTLNKLITIEEKEILISHIHKLPKNYADILCLRFYYDNSTKEIADILKIKENNVYIRMNRAINALRKILPEEMRDAI